MALSGFSFLGVILMDILHDKISKLYSEYLLAAFGSALISCIYWLVDMVVVGQYYGLTGSQAMAVSAPIWNIIYSLGLLVGIGESVLFSYFKEKKKKTKVICIFPPPLF